MKKLLPIVLFLAVIIIAGCSKTYKDELVNVKPPTKPLKAKVLKPDFKHEELSYRAYDYYVTALDYEEQKDYTTAAKYYTRALQFHPNSYEIRYSLALNYYWLAQYQDVINLLDVISPNDEDVLLLRGAAYMSSGKADSAVTNYIKLVKLDPDNMAAYMNLSSYYSRTHNLDSLIWVYENITRLRPYLFSNWRDLATYQAQNGEYEKAKQSFQGSLKHNATVENISAYVGLAEMHYLLKHVDSTISTYKQVLEIAPDNIIANTELSLLYVRLDSISQALPYAQNVVVNSPKDLMAKRRLAILYYGTDSLKSADSLFTIIVNAGNVHPINHFYLGRIAIAQEEYEIAVDEFKILTQLADTAIGSWLDLGFAYRKLKDFDNEIKTYQTALPLLKNKDSEVKLLFTMGAAYEQDGQIEEAVSIFEKLITHKPDYAQALNYLGYMLADRNQQLDYAKDLIKKAIKLEPDNPAFLDSYGWVYYRLNKFKKAIKHLKKASSLLSDPIIYDHMGDAYKAIGDHDKAVIWWKKALELTPDDMDIKNKLNQ